MIKNTFTNGLRNAVISFLLLIPYNFLAFAVGMLISEGGFTPMITLPATIFGIGILFLCSRRFLRDLPSIWQTLLSISALPLIYTGIAALIYGRHFLEGIYTSFFLSSVVFPVSVFLNDDAPVFLQILSYALGVLLPFAALYGGTLFQPMQTETPIAHPTNHILKNSAISFFSWLIAESICGALYFSGMYQLIVQGDTFEVILGLFFAVVLCLVPYIVPLVCGKYFGECTKNAATDLLSCCIPFLLLAVARVLVTLFVAENSNVYTGDALLYFRIPPTTMGFIYFIVPFLPGSEVVGGTMRSVIPDALYGILPGISPSIAYFIGMQIQKRCQKGRDTDA